MYRSFKERVYECMIDEVISEYKIAGVENAFEEGSYCMNLYGEAYDAYRRLCHRLHAGDEDPDVEIIFRAFLQMQKVLCFRMYQYGAQFGLKDEE